MAESFLSNVDVDRVEQLLTDTSEHVKYFNEVSDNIVNGYTYQLDQLMKDIYNNAVLVDYPDVNVLEKYFLQLTNMIYFMGEKLEQLGIRDDMSKSAMKEVYNNTYLDAQTTDYNGNKKVTVAELTAKAEGASIYENVVNSIYARSYKQVKYKIDAANEMIRTLSKIMSKRMSEMQLTMQTSRYSDKEGDEFGTL